MRGNRIDERDWENACWDISAGTPAKTHADEIRMANNQLRGNVFWGIADNYGVRNAIMPFLQQNNNCSSQGRPAQNNYNAGLAPVDIFLRDSYREYGF